MSDNLSCKYVISLISKYIDARCTLGESILLEEHCAKCKDCRTSLMQAKKQIKGTPVKDVLFLSRPKNLDYLQKTDEKEKKEEEQFNKTVIELKRSEEAEAKEQPDLHNQESEVHKKEKENHHKRPVIKMENVALMTEAARSHLQRHIPKPEELKKTVNGLSSAVTSSGKHINISKVKERLSQNSQEAKKQLSTTINRISPLKKPNDSRKQAIVPEPVEKKKNVKVPARTTTVEKKAIPFKKSIPIEQTYTKDDSLSLETSSADLEIDWKDPVLESRMREITGISSGDIMFSDVYSIVRLDLSNYYAKDRIRDISALSYLTNLTDLNLSSNNISDISALSSLTNLTSLSLSVNNISDISALSSLTNLFYLSLGSNNISDISALSSLTNLVWLNLNSNNISDVSALSSLTNLLGLHLGSNSISDISALSYMTALRWLDIENNLI